MCRQHSSLRSAFVHLQWSVLTAHAVQASCFRCHAVKKSASDILNIVTFENFGDEIVAVFCGMCRQYSSLRSALDNLQWSVLTAHAVQQATCFNGHSVGKTASHFLGIITFDLSVNRMWMCLVVCAVSILHCEVDLFICSGLY